jgi:hypothetical protein
VTGVGVRMPWFIALNVFIAGPDRYDTPSDLLYLFGRAMHRLPVHVHGT